MDLSAWKKAKKEQKLNYEDIARLSGVPITTVKNVFCGYTATPRIDTVEAIERALGIRVSDGITEEDLAAGHSENITVSITADIYEWIEIGINIREEKGKEFFESLKKVVSEISKKS